ncbi:MAG TPA: glycosyl hydrolase family 17 protein [Cyclobacteriaceae bacterium]
MKWILCIIISILLALITSCNQMEQKQTTNIKQLTAEEILGNPAYPAISYGGFRKKTLEEAPTIEELKEDMEILYAMGIRIIRTYKTQKTPQVKRLLQAIKELKTAKKDFEMYVMMGIWIDCAGAFTDSPDHSREDVEENTAEIEEAIRLTQKYPDIVKVLAVGNEAMVKWAATYFVQPGVILKWVKHLVKLREEGELPKDIWITSSDNFASWGGGGSEYHVDDLNELIRSVDYLSIHTYPMHDTHYNPVFWGLADDEENLPKKEQIDQIMNRALAYAQSQYSSVKQYMDSIRVSKPIHIGETGWASCDSDNHHYGRNGSKATDEYKEAIYYRLMREWTDNEGISCFYFEAFDEPWKDARNPGGSENHFGLFTVDGKAKYALWALVDQGVFEGLSRGGNSITKTYNGNVEQLLKEVKVPPVKESLLVN